MKRNKLYTVNSWNRNQFIKNSSANTYPLGGLTKVKNFLKENEDWGDVASTAGDILGNTISQGKTSGVGNIINTVGDIAGDIPVFGGFMKGAANLVGGLVNTAFGSKLNKENIAKFENQNTAQANTIFGASNDDEVLSNFANSSILSDVSRSEVGSDGWFSSKVKRKTRAINNARQAANAHTQAALLQSVDNLDTNKDFGIMANFAADGGPIIIFPSSGQDSASFGAVDYSLRANKLALEQQKLNGKFPKTSPNTFSLNTEVLKTFSDGGGIHIDPKNRGKFNETKRRTGKTTEELTHSKNPLTRKRAIFAQNAAKWHHANGGYVQGGTYDLDEAEIQRLIDAGYQIQYE